MKSHWTHAAAHFGLCLNRRYHSLNNVKHFLLQSQREMFVLVNSDVNATWDEPETKIFLNKWDHEGKISQVLHFSAGFTGAFHSIRLLIVDSLSVSLSNPSCHRRDVQRGREEERQRVNWMTWNCWKHDTEELHTQDVLPLWGWQLASCKVQLLKC